MSKGTCPLCNAQGEDLVFAFYCANPRCKNYREHKKEEAKAEDCKPKKDCKEACDDKKACTCDDDDWQPIDWNSFLGDTTDFLICTPLHTKPSVDWSEYKNVFAVFNKLAGDPKDIKTCLLYRKEGTVRIGHNSDGQPVYILLEKKPGARFFEMEINQCKVSFCVSVADLELSRTKAKYRLFELDTPTCEIHGRYSLEITESWMEELKWQRITRSYYPDPADPIATVDPAAELSNS